jgi:hypothetical protein
MRRNRRLHVGVTTDLETDAVADGEAGFLAHPLYPADELPSQSFEPQLFGDGRVDCRDESSGFLDRQIARRALEDLDVLREQLV